ncbi:MAG: hypothetical protein ACLQVJ_20745 [Syntrophobacteraceae bacterium]
MRRYGLVFSVFILFFLVSILTICGANPAVGAQSRPATYFSNGQAVYDPQDPAKSQQLAIQDFMVQGLTQAIGSFLSPAQMGAQFAEIQKRVLAKPAKYVDSYQVFSQEQTGGMFRVVGQVTVSVGALKEDLEKSGILAAQQKDVAQPAPSAAVSAPAAATERENARVEEDVEPAEEPDESQPSASQPPVIGQGAGKPSYRGIAATKREILWAVAEKWDQEWVLPTESGNVSSLFARSLGKEMDDNNFSLLFPQPGSVKMDLSGNIPPSQVISVAEGLGIQDVVVGKVSYAEDRNSKQVSLDASLRVIRIGQGKSEFEVHKAQSMEEMSNQDGALELARRIAPQLIGVLGGPQAGGTQRSGAGSSTPGGPSPAQEASVGPLLINLPSAQYPNWMELESILHEQFKNMQITSLRIGATESAVQLDGVNGEYILKMSGTRLPSGATVRIDSYSTETQTMKVSFSSSGGVQAETR